MDLSKLKTPTEVLQNTSKTIKYNYEGFYKNHVNFYNMHKTMFGEKNFSAVMESEQITLCEINACLWVKAIYSATNSITKYTYSHYIIVQKFINYLLNTDLTENFGLIENYFWKLLLTHPPNPEMFDYYGQIIFDNFICLDGKSIENQTLFFCLIEAIVDCLKIKINPDGNKGKNNFSKYLERSSKNGLDFTGLHDFTQLQSKENLNAISSVSSNQKQIYFNELSWKEKIERCFMVLNFVYNILETDFIFWLHSKKFTSPTDNNRPLILNLFWKNQRDFGSVNEEIQKLFQLYKLGINLDFQNTHVIDKLITLTGEVIRWSDSIKGTNHPFVGANSINFSRELSLALHYRLAEMKGDMEENELIVNFKPSWLRLFLCSHLLTIITKRQCFPELTGIYDILEYIVRMENKYANSEKVLHKSSDRTNLLVKKREKFENVNKKLRNGKTHLHLACQNNDVKKIKRLLTFPELDVNATDQDGWTPLHIAAYLGKTASVKELLLYSPKPGSNQKLINTRATGPEITTPLMCAASQGHGNVCKLLLEHSGSILLEDVNEFNQTAFELTKASDVRRILKYYKSDLVWTENNFKEINFDLGYKKVVMKLCVELIQAYFSTYKTWDCYKKIVDSEFKWNDLCCDTDLQININKIKILLPELASIKEFKSLSDIYKKIFTLIKTS